MAYKMAYEVVVLQEAEWTVQWEDNAFFGL